MPTRTFSIETFESSSNRRGNILNYGPPKTGKTTALYTLIKLGLRPIWVHDFDRGVDPFIRFAKKYGLIEDPKNDIKIFRYDPKGGDKIGQGITRPAGQGRDLYLDFCSNINGLYDHVDPNTGSWKEGLPYGTVPAVSVVDSASALQEIILDYVLAMLGHNLGDPKTDARNDFGRQMGKSVEIIKSMLSLPMISIWIAHESIERNELTGEIRNDPHFTGKLAPVIGREFGTVLYSTTRTVNGQIEYVWQCQPQGYIKTAGSRFKDVKGMIPQDYGLVI